MNVAIFHPFTNFADNYSLSHVVQEQMMALVENGVDVCFITHKAFKEKTPEGVDVLAILTPNREEVYEGVKFFMEDFDYVLTHDVVYIDSYKEYDMAIRRLAKEFPDVKWLHWIHSAPRPTEKRKPIPNSTYIGMNYTDLHLLAEQLQVPVAHCRVIYNPVSPDVFFEWHQFTRQLVKKHDLLDCDVLVVYPLDTGRFASKGGHKIMKLIEKMRQKGKNAKVVFVNAAANEEGRRRLVESLATDYAIFTSFEDKKYEVVVPRRVVRELMQIANVFPLLSDSEGCSLTMIEAGLSGLLVILNEDFPPMREFGEIDHVFYMKTGSTRCTTEYENEDAYYSDWANNVISELENNKALRFKRKMLNRFNRQFIWKNQLEPLLK